MMYQEHTKHFHGTSVESKFELARNYEVIPEYAPMDIPDLAPDGGYGFFCDEDQQGDDTSSEFMSSSFDGSTKSHDSISSDLSTTSSESCSLSPHSSSEFTILCEIEDESSPVSIRYFPTGNTVIASVQGFRIVNDAMGDDAEYKVKLSVDGTTYFAWRRHSDFEAIATACATYFHRMQPADSFQTCFDSEKEERSRCFENTLRAWHAVQKNRNQSNGNNYLAADFLVKETNLLKLFTKYLLFESPCLDMLTAFMCNQI